MKTYGRFWPEKYEEGISSKIFSELMKNNLRNGKQTKAFDSEETIFSIAVDIAEGMQYLHSRRIGDRNVGPENVILRIIDDKLMGRAKLFSFQASREIITIVLTKSYNSNQLTLLCAPPEEFLGRKTTYSYDL